MLLSLIIYAALLAAGALLWTFVEYGLHNWGGHVPKGKNELSREHLAHHKDVTYFTPHRRKLLLAGPVVTVFLALAGPASAALTGSMAYGVTLVAGFAAGWLAYEVLHRRIHTHAPLNAYGTWARRHHLHHHFAEPRMNHGVTTDLWDRVFGTLAAERRIRIPERKIAGWMLDPRTGELLPAFADTYELVRRRRSS